MATMVMRWNVMTEAGAAAKPRSRSNGDGSNGGDGETVIMADMDQANLRQL